LDINDQVLDLKNFKTELQAIAGKRIIAGNEKKIIRTELLKDLYKELKNTDRRKLNELAEKITEFVINEMRDKRHEQG